MVYFRELSLLLTNMQQEGIQKVRRLFSHCKQVDKLDIKIVAWGQNLKKVRQQECPLSGRQIPGHKRAKNPV